VFRNSVLALETVAGIVLVIAVLFDVFETMVLSRRVSRRTRITTVFYRLTWPAWRAAARRFPEGNRRENFLTIYGPASLLLLIVCWAMGLVFAFALLHLGLDPTLRTVDGQSGFWVAVYMSGTTYFTLGLGDVASHGAAGRALTVLECGMGLGLLTLVISYLPALSQAFSAREVNISLLDARAGSPPTAMELLLRHRGDASGESLGELLREWERWSAELLESHVSFPVLAYYRSQHDNQSWVSALTAVLDVCAFVMASARRGPIEQAQLTFRDRAPRARRHVPRLRTPADAAQRGSSAGGGASPAARIVRRHRRPGGGRREDGAASRRAPRDVRAGRERAVEDASHALPAWFPAGRAHDNWMSTL
jgi:hypothetical protein